MVFYTCFCREDDDRYVRDGTVLLDFAYHRDTIHHRHGYIGEDEVWHFGASLVETRLAVFCQEHIVLFFEYAAEVQTQVGVVFHNKNGEILAWLVRGGTLLFFLLFVFCLFFLLFFFQLFQVLGYGGVIYFPFNFLHLIAFLINVFVESAVNQEVGIVIESQYLVEHIQHLS